MESRVFSTSGELDISEQRKQFYLYTATTTLSEQEGKLFLQVYSTSTVTTPGN